MSFLRRFFKSWGGLWPPKFLRLSVGGKIRDDLLARFLTSRQHFSATKGIVKANGFMPPPELKLSVFQIHELSSTEVWQLGFKYCADPPLRNVHARADLPKESVGDVGLTLDMDNTPPRHASIAGWPAEKSKQKLHALQLAQRASLSIAPGR